MSKVIQLSIASGPFASKSMLSQVASMSPEKAINVSDMRKRVRIIEAIENGDSSFVIETDDYDLLKSSIQSFPFNVASKEILQVIDDVLNAVDGPVITKAMRDAAIDAAVAPAKAA